MGALLQYAGLSVSTVDDQVLAASLLRVEAWDIVLSDFSMPGMDGVDFMREAARVCPSARTGVQEPRSATHPKVLAALWDGLLERVVLEGMDVRVLLDALGVRGLPAR